MYLSNLKLWNFRKFGSDQEIDLNRPNLEIPFKMGLNVLIGENDSGKTAIIDAIKLVLKTHSYERIWLEDEDFFNDKTIDSKRLRIECEFTDFLDCEARHFTEWLGFKGEGKTADIFLRVILDASRSDERILPYDVRAGVDDVGYPLSAEARDYLKTTYLRPLRDAKTELVPRKNSRLSQILIGHPSFKDKDRHDLVVISDDLGTKVEKYFVDTEDGKKVRTEIERFLGSFFGEKTNANFSFTPKELKSILEILKLSLEEKNLGLGSQNLLFIAAELLNLERGDWDGIRLGLIEELEAHLHPQAQLRVIDFLQEQKNFQLILSTHSPNLGSKVKLENLFLFDNTCVYPMDDTNTLLKQSDYGFLERFLDVTKSNLFFAKGIILVEGWAEELLLPAIAKKIGIDLVEKGISIVNVGSTAFLRYSKIFQRKNESVINIPVAVITDVDIKPAKYKQFDANAKTEENNDINKIKDAKKAKYDGQKVKTFVSPHWTLEYCIALSPLLREILFNSIKSAGEEEGKNIKSEWATFSKGKSKEVLALDLYYGLVKKKNISKAILAQHLAENVEKAEIANKVLEKDPELEYLIEALNYVAETKNTSTWQGYKFYGKGIVKGGQYL